MLEEFLKLKNLLKANRSYDVQRRFQIAPLIPSDRYGDTTKPEPESFRVAYYEPEAETLGETLPDNAEFHIADAGELPEWAQRAYDEIGTTIGYSSGLVIYRVRGDDTVYVKSFLETFHVGKEENVVYMVNHLSGTVENSRYVQPESHLRHDKVFTATLTTPPGFDYFLPHTITFGGSIGYPILGNDKFSTATLTTSPGFDDFLPYITTYGGCIGYPILVSEDPDDPRTSPSLNN